MSGRVPGGGGVSGGRCKEECGSNDWVESMHTLQQGCSAMKRLMSLVTEMNVCHVCGPASELTAALHFPLFAQGLSPSGRAGVVGAATPSDTMPF